MHDADPGRQDDGLVDVVRDEEHGLARRPPDLDQLALHGGTGVRVECGERLVHQQHLRLVGEHARDLDALLHAAGQLGRMLVVLALQPDEIEIAVRLARAARRAAACACAARTRRCRAPRATDRASRRPGIPRHGPRRGPRWPGRQSRRLPDVAGSNPAIMLSTVVLPQPLVPSRQKNSPVSMSRSKSRTAT